MAEYRARFWTRSEVKETLKECVNVGMEVEENNNIWTARDPHNNGVMVFRALLLDDEKVHACRLNTEYFNF